jgi:hypothetical protein
MSILPALAVQFQALFPATTHGQRRSRWFILTLQAILVPITASRTSNLRRAISTLFGVVIAQSRYYTFMASVKLPWTRVWETLWRAIPDPLTAGRLLLALDDSLNPKTGRKVFGCQTTFDHAAKTNQSPYPWAQTIVTVVLLKVIHGRWSGLPLAFAFYLRLITRRDHGIRVGGEALRFETKLAQAVALIRRIGAVFPTVPVLVVCDSWFGNNGLFKPLRQALGPRAQWLSRLRTNAALYDLPTRTPGRSGRPRQYGERLGNAGSLATTLQPGAQAYTLNLYGQRRTVMAIDRVVILKTLRCQVRVVWVFRTTQWVALVTTDMDLYVAQITEYYGVQEN